ncbi:hypothetical protein GF369_03915 [Candidatus Peregrinibacteria bacterium]|nr:hypothetical protein [Candidatus Peregrinibacteria bacterium]
MAKKDNTFIKEKYRSTGTVKKDYKASPFEKYSGRFSASFGTLLLGMILSVIGLVLLGYSEGIDNDINVVKRSPLIHHENLMRSSGMIKLTGTPTVKQGLFAPGVDEELLYYEMVRQQKSGEKWETISIQKLYIPFSLGDIAVDMPSAELQFDVKELSAVEQGDTREVVRGVPVNDEVVVIGRLHDQAIDGGVVFVVTNKAQKDLLDAMTHMGTIEWWLYKVGALLLVTLGITSFVLPILTFLDIFPKISLAVIGFILLSAFLLASLLIFISAIVITFWWLIFVIVGLVLILLIRIKSKKHYQPISFVP